MIKKGISWITKQMPYGSAELKSRWHSQLFYVTFIAPFNNLLKLDKLFQINNSAGACGCGPLHNQACRRPA